MHDWTLDLLRRIRSDEGRDANPAVEKHEENTMLNGKRMVTLALVLPLVLLASVPGAHGAYSVVDVSNGGAIKGKVTFAGSLPEDAIEEITITKNTEVCGEGQRRIVWIDVKDSALRGVFVFLDGIEQGMAWPEPDGGQNLIVQKNCRFTPWAQVVKPGSLTVRNSDSGVLHNINARELIGVERGRPVRRTIFNVGQPEMGDIEQELKVRRSPFVAINCEAHNFMFGYMMAPEHPYAVVVDDRGAFVIDNVPPGTYTLKAWHPKLGLKSAEVTVSAGAAAEMSFEFAN